MELSQLIALGHARRRVMALTEPELMVGQHYDSSSIHVSVTNTTFIRVILVLMLMANWTANVVDVKGAFLHGEFTDGEDFFNGSATRIWEALPR